MTKALKIRVQNGRLSAWTSISSARARHVGWLAINHPECAEDIAKDRAAITAIKSELAIRRKEAMLQTSKPFSF